MLVLSENFRDIMQEIQNISELASFVSIDCEFTGCGNYNHNCHIDAEQRYEAIKHLVNGHSLISLGLTYWIKKESENYKITYKIYNYTFLLSVNDEFMSTPSSLKFLVEHGFDFNLLFSKGISYSRAKGKIMNSSPGTFHYLFSILRETNIPIVLHNGILDIAFIYRSFFNELPDKLDSFISSLLGWFPTIFDTKYLATFHMNETTSYLEYLFKKSERENECNGVKRNVDYFTISNPLSVKEDYRNEKKNTPLCNFCVKRILQIRNKL